MKNKLNQLLFIGILVLTCTLALVGCKDDSEPTEERDEFTNYYDGEEDFHLNKWQNGVTADVFEFTDGSDGLEVKYSKPFGENYTNIINYIEGQLKFDYLVFTMKGTKDYTSVMVQAPINYGEGEVSNVIEATFDVSKNFETYCISIPLGSRPQLEVITGVLLFPEPGSSGSAFNGTITIEETYFTDTKPEGCKEIAGSSGGGAPVREYGEWSNEYTWTKYVAESNDSNEINVTFRNVAEYGFLTRKLPNIQENHNTLEFEFTSREYQTIAKSVTQMNLVLRGDAKEFVDNGDASYWLYHEVMIHSYLQDEINTDVDGNVKIKINISEALKQLQGKATKGLKLVVFAESRPDGLGDPENPNYDGNGSFRITKVATSYEAAELNKWTAPTYNPTTVNTEVTLKNVKVTDADGNIFDTVVTVKDSNGDIVNVVDGKFTPTITGDYTISYKVEHKNDIKESILKVVEELSLEDLKEKAINDLQALILDVDTDKYSIEKIEEMKKIVLDAIEDINSASTQEEINNIVNKTIIDIEEIEPSGKPIVGEFTGDAVTGDVFTVDGNTVTYDEIVAQYKQIYKNVSDYTFAYDRLNGTITNNSNHDIKITVRVCGEAIGDQWYAQILNNAESGGEFIVIPANSTINFTTIMNDQQGRVAQRIEIYFSYNEGVTTTGNSLTFDKLEFAGKPSSPTLSTVTSMTPLITIEGNNYSFDYSTLDGGPVNKYQGIKFNLDSYDNTVANKIKLSIVNTGNTEFVLEFKFTDTNGNDGYAAPITVTIGNDIQIATEWLWGSLPMDGTTISTIEIFVNSMNNANADTVVGSFTMDAELILE